MLNYSTAFRNLVESRWVWGLSPPEISVLLVMWCTSLLHLLQKDLGLDSLTGQFLARWSIDPHSWQALWMLDTLLNCCGGRWLKLTHADWTNSIAASNVRSAWVSKPCLSWVKCSPRLSFMIESFSSADTATPAIAWRFLQDWDENLSRIICYEKILKPRQHTWKHCLIWIAIFGYSSKFSSQIGFCYQNTILLVWMKVM